MRHDVDHTRDDVALDVRHRQAALADAAVEVLLVALERLALVERLEVAVQGTYGTKPVISSRICFSWEIVAEA